jgi:hypothetical protein
MEAYFLEINGIPFDIFFARKFKRGLVLSRIQMVYCTRKFILLPQIEGTNYYYLWFGILFFLHAPDKIGSVLKYDTLSES